MAVLTNQDRFDLWAEYMRDAAVGIIGVMTKADLRAAVNAVDDWVSTNAAAFNSALPLPARTSLTQQQKTLLFCWVALRRAGILKVDEDVT